MPVTSPPIAVIDLGTNTFHLLIVNGMDEHGNFDQVFKERKFVKLAEDGIGTIGVVPFQRGIEALAYFRKIMDENGVKEYRATGTAALRTASNGSDFVEEALKEARIKIDLIPGEEEARLITKGVLLAIPSLANDRILIMDIGGGSVEFIIADAEATLWARSFPVGVAVLKAAAHRTEPISKVDHAVLVTFLHREFEPLWQALQQHPTNHLVGAAGTFDVVANLMGSGQPTPNSHTITLDKFRKFAVRCILANLEERYQIPGLPRQRAELIVVAVVLIQLVLDEAEIKRGTVSNYAMKEGILAEMLTP